MHTIWKCGHCGMGFGELTEHPQAPNQCPNCLANIQGLGLPGLAEAKAQEEAAKSSSGQPTVVETSAPSEPEPAAN